MIPCKWTGSSTKNNLILNLELRTSILMKVASAVKTNLFKIVLYHISDHVEIKIKTATAVKVS